MNTSNLTRFTLCSKTELSSHWCPGTVYEENHATEPLLRLFRGASYLCLGRGEGGTKITNVNSKRPSARRKHLSRVTEQGNAGY
jgi:hypothetical protein